MSTEMSPTSASRHEGAPHVKAIVYTSPAHAVAGGRGTFSPTTATLLAGAKESVLIDAQYMPADINALEEIVERSGTTLTTIYITHGHGDHYFGIGALLDRFPQARAVATAGVVDYIRETLDSQRAQWSAMFAGAAVEPTVLPEPLSGDTIDLEGTELKVIEVGQGDIKPSTVVHVPEIATVISGDVVYNEIHAMLGLSGPDEWREWIQSIDRVEELRPRAIVAGHKKPDASDEAVEQMLDGTRRYITDFAEATENAADAKELETMMMAKYESLGNPWTLRFSAHAQFPS